MYAVLVEGRPPREFPDENAARDFLLSPAIPYEVKAWKYRAERRSNGALYWRSLDVICQPGELRRAFENLHRWGA